MLSRIQIKEKLAKDKYILLLDQALLSVVNFGSILLLSKLASINVFASFVVLYSYSYFIYIFSTYYLSSPVLIFLSKKWKNQEGEYLTTSLFLNLIINLLISVVAFYFLKSQVDNISFFNFFMLSFSMSFFDILKKFIFSSKNIHVKYGLYSTILLNILFFVLLVLLRNSLTVSLILIVYWISFFASNTLLFLFFTQKRILSVRDFSFGRLSFIIDVIKTHYHYSKWIILGGLAFWGYNQGIYIVAKSYHIDDLVIGKVRTIQNLLGVFSILLITLENHYTPIFSEKSIKGNILVLNTLIFKVFKDNYLKILILFLLAIPIGLLFYNFVYLDKYGDGTVIFLLFWVVQLLLLIIRPFAIALKSIENTSPFFLSHLVAVIAMLIVIPLLLYFEYDYTVPVALVIANGIYVGYIAIHYLNKKNSLRKNEHIK